MTNKEAIQVLQRTAWLGGETYGLQNRAEQVAEAIRMAIDALEISDSISQQLDCREFHKKLNNSNDEVNNSNLIQLNAIKTKVKGMTAYRVPGDDCISRQAAINAVYESAVGKQMLSGHRDLIETLKHLPSAQPDTTAPTTDTTADTISRQSVLSYIDRIKHQGTGKEKSFDFLEKYVSKLPSVQPEIIRCKDCKHRGEKPIADGRYWCEVHDTFMYYCSDAERRTDEID